jgi:NAD(P)-dependent dehydrogenase (short-subunit alcohol dehydrogenase family)
MDLQLQNKTALVTGSTAGIGFAIAKMLAQEGATVAVNGRTTERVMSAINTIKSDFPGAKLIPMAADLTSRDGMAAVIKALPEINILVNNLGIYEVKSFFDITDDEWRRIFDINVMSGVRLSRHYLKHMLDKNWGRVLFISSESGIQIPAEMIHYGVTKTAQISLARGLAELTVNSNVTVNSVLPGPTRSEGVEHFITSVAKEKNITEEQLEKEFFSTMRPSSLLKRFATLEEVAALVVYLCGPLSSATNGAALRVDGGVIRAI